MRPKKSRSLPNGPSGSTPSKNRPRDASEGPGFLVRLVGKARAKTLCREGVVHPRRD